MSLELTLRPSSIEGIKRLADRIKRDQAIKHADALERASQAAGYSNYPHARHALTLQSTTAPVARHDIHITAYWRDLPAAPGVGDA